MPDRRHALTPDALAMIDAIAREGSFAGAARELGKVPSALTYSVRQLEEALDVLLFDRSARQAQLTPAGQTLVDEGRRLLQEIDAVANRVRRVAAGWESTLAVCVDDALSQTTVYELVQDFAGVCGAPGVAHAGTRLRLVTGVLTGTWEPLVSGEVDLAIGVGDHHANPGGIELAPLGELRFVYCMAPHHPLARVEGTIDHAQLGRHRAVAVADSARRLAPLTLNMLPGQDVLTVPSMRAKLEALLRGLGTGFLPEPMARVHVEAGQLVERPTAYGENRIALNYAWRGEQGPQSLGLGLRWWLAQLARPATRTALLERHAGLRF